MSPRAAVLLEAFGFNDVADYTNGKADWLARGLPMERADDTPAKAGDLAVQGPLLELEMAASDCASLIDHHDGNAGVVVGEGGVVLGLLTREAASSSPDAVAEEIMELGPSTFRADEDLETVLDHMDRNEVAHVVISDPDGAVIGLLKRSDAKVFEDQ
jgi:CBS domain-containing protein